MLNPEKSRELRPLRIFLAVLCVVLFVLVFDNLPTTRKPANSASENSAKNAENDGSNRENLKILSAETISDDLGANSSYFCTFPDLIEELESDLESRLASLGVPEEEYGNLAEYLSKDELYLLEAKATLATELELSTILATGAEIRELAGIFSNLGSDSSCTPANLEGVADSNQNASADENSDENSDSFAPSEYKPLSDLLKTYQKTLSTVEDYDEIVFQKS